MPRRRAPASTPALGEPRTFRRESVTHTCPQLVALPHASLLA